MLRAWTAFVIACLGARSAAAQSLPYEPPAEGQHGMPLTIRITPPPGIRFRTLNLLYHPGALPDFAEIEMERNDDGVYEASIPEFAMRSKTLAFFVEARDALDEPVAATATREAPHVVRIAGEADARTRRLAAAAIEVRKPSAREGDGAAPRFFVGVVAGTGLGHVSGRAEVFDDVDNRGVGWSPLTIEPTAGIYLGHAVLAIAARWQPLLGAGDPGATVARDHPDAADAAATGALAVLLRFGWQGQLGPASFIAGPQLGYGALRYRADLRPRYEYVDTVLGGPFLAGASLTVRLPLGDRFFFQSLISALGAFGTSQAVHADLGLGVGMDL